MTVRQELQDIYERHGILTPGLVVDEARNSNHPLHSKFEWDDTLAAEAHRRQQAQNLIRSVRIRYVGETTDQVSDAVRAFTSVRTPAGYAYQPTLEVIADPLKVRMVLADMRREWQAMKRRYEGYEQFWLLVEADLPKDDPKEIEVAQHDAA